LVGGYVIALKCLYNSLSWACVFHGVFLIAGTVEWTMEWAMGTIF